MSRIGCRQQLVRRNRKHIKKIKGESPEHQAHDEEFMDIVYLPDSGSEVISSSNNMVDPDEERAGNAEQVSGEDLVSLRISGL